jgi:hypothetical protein
MRWKRWRVATEGPPELTAWYQNEKHSERQPGAHWMAATGDLQPFAKGAPYASTCSASLDTASTIRLISSGRDSR